MDRLFVVTMLRGEPEHVELGEEEFSFHHPTYCSAKVGSSPSRLSAAFLPEALEGWQESLQFSMASSCKMSTPIFLDLLPSFLSCGVG